MATEKRPFAGTHWLYGGTAAMMGFFPRGEVLAQEASARSAVGLEEVVVTARRREENVQSIPVAVSVLSADALAREAIVSPQDLNAHVPSLSVNSTSNTRDSSVYNLRGQGQAFAGSDPAVVAYFAEVPSDLTGPGSLFDLQSVQVPKGPQGTLFGRNTTGGAILLQPTRPGDEFGGYLSVAWGDYRMRRVQGAVDLPIVSDKLLARLALDVNERRGFTTDADTGIRYDDRNYEAIRLSIVARPFEGFENYTVASYSDSDTSQSGVSLTGLDPTGPLAPVLGSFYSAQVARGPRVVQSDVGPGYQVIRNFGVTNITSYDISDAVTVKNIFGYRLFKFKTTLDVDATTVPLIQHIPSPFYGSGATTTPSSEAVSNELQVQAKLMDDRLSLIGGLYYERRVPEDDSNTDIIIQFGEVTSLQSLKRDTSKAVFAQGTYALTDDLRLTIGGRYTWDDRSQKASNFNVASGPDAGCRYPIPVPNCVAENSAEFSAFSGNASLDYQLTSDTLLYGAVRRGYKSGGFNSATPSPTDRVFQPEYVTDFELGAKSEFRLGDAPGRVNLAVYRSEFEDWHQNGVIIEGGQFLTLTRNSGQGRIQGVELEALVRPVPWLSMSGFYAYTDPEYTRNTINGVDLRTRPFFNVPENMYSVSGEIERSLGDRIGTASVSATYSYQSDVYFQEGFFPNVSNPNAGQDGYGLLNLRASLRNVGGMPLEISAFMTNVTDEEYKIFESDIYELAGFSTAIYGEPRTWGVEMRYSFGAEARN